MLDAITLLGPLEGFLASLGVGSLLLDDDARTISWNREFPRMFSEHAGHIRKGERYAETLRRFYRARLQEPEMPDIDAHVAKGMETHFREAGPFECLCHGLRFRGEALRLPGLGRLLAWTVSRSFHDGEHLVPVTAPAGTQSSAEGLELVPGPDVFHARLAAMLDSLGIASLLLDDDARTVGWNSAFLRMFPEHAGFIHRDEPYVENLRRFYLGRLNAAEMPNVADYIADGLERHRRQVEPFEFLHRDRWLRVVVLPLPGLGRLRAWTVSRGSHDGEHLASEMAYAGTRTTPGVIDQISDGLMVRDSADRIVLSNRRFAELYGLDASEHGIGRTFPEILDTAWAGTSGAEKARQSWADNSRFAGAPFELPLPGDRWVRVRDYRSPNGSLVSTHVDVTDLVRLRRSADEAQRRAEELSVRLSTEMEQRKQAEARTLQMARLSSLGQMATGLAHELNQPLAIITLSADVAKLRLEALGAGALGEALERLETIAAAAMRARGIIDNVRRFGRADTAGSSREPLDLCEATRSALALIETTIRSSGIALEARLPGKPLWVMGDAISMQDMVLNLLMNARDAVAAKRPARGTIGLCLEQRDGDVLLTVADNGGGFSEEALRCGFEPFFTTKPPGKGTGIGLSIAQSTIQAAGGTIHLSNVDDGAAVHVRLPAATGRPRLA